MPRAPKAPGHAARRPPWRNSTRRARLPGNWDALVAFTRDRAGGRCEWPGRYLWQAAGWRCDRPGRECDHIKPGDDHSKGNLQWLCTPHHRDKTRLDQQVSRAARKGLRG